MGRKLPQTVGLILVAAACSVMGFGALHVRAQPSPPDPGTVVLFDDLSNPATGVLPTLGNDQFAAQFSDGDYVIQTKVPGRANAFARVNPAGQFDDHSIEVDVRLAPDTSDRGVFLECRGASTATGISGYRVLFFPRSGQLGLFRVDAGAQVGLSTDQLTLVANLEDAWNHLELSCVGPTISAVLNGSLVAQAQDSTYTAGRVNLGAVSQRANLSAEAHFRNLQVTYQPTVPSNAPAIATNAAPGTILLNDTLADPAQGVLSTNLMGIKQGDLSYDTVYDAGDFVIRTARSVNSNAPGVQLPGTYSDSSLAVDARLTGDSWNRQISLGCRVQNGGGYFAFVTPRTQHVELFRGNGNDLASLATSVSPAVRRGGQPNHIELDCVGTTIAVAVNGTTVLVVQDDRYAQGTLNMALAFTFQPGLAGEARFDNLKVTYPSTSTIPPVQALAPGTVIIADDLSDPNSGVLPPMSDHPAAFDFGYQGGEYRTVITDPNNTGDSVAFIPATFGDTTTAVDVRITGANGNPHATIVCRFSDSGFYLAAVDLNGGGLFIFKVVGTGGTFEGNAIGVGSFPPVSPVGQPAHVALTCAGSNIWASVNGTVVAAVQDSSYTSGAIGVGVGDDKGVSPEVRWRNLKITAADPSAPAPAVGGSAPTAAVPMSVLP